MSNRFVSFFAALLLHSLLVVMIYFSVFRKHASPPPAVVLEISLLSDKANESHENNKSHYLKLDEQAKVQHYHKSSDFDLSDTAEKFAPVFNPLPQIPNDLRDEVFESVAVARFFIDAAGSVARVELIKPCANPRLNNLLLKSLKSWRFSATAANSTQDIRVSFKVE